jgi:hypothetical protein
MTLQSSAILLRISLIIEIREDHYYSRADNVSYL